jgi:hypothetical protein
MMPSGHQLIQANHPSNDEDIHHVLVLRPQQLLNPLGDYGQIVAHENEVPCDEIELLACHKCPKVVRAQVHLLVPWCRNTGQATILGTLLSSGAFQYIL